MEEVKTQTQIDEINSKLDLILEEIELQKKHRREMEDLKDDLFRVGKDVYETAVTELEEVHDHIKTGDIVHLGKKLLRNVNNLNRAFDQLESTRDFLHDISPLVRESIIDTMNKMDEFDRKGYFEFIKELQKAGDNVVTSFTPNDVKQLGENVVTILNTIKNLTQPDMLQAINNAISVYKNIDVKVDENISLFGLMRELNTPEVKRGLAVGLKFLKNLASIEENQEKLININKEQIN
ncbi:MAG: DUF1641 domain-containing protein [Ignavibacteria bacterium]|nr:DUF1641 domain-containing protein [Ignavibacteria bacterium]MBT8382685.1 DUF1641 domain-containing protein [Ignavibacteria bacterium]MBT8391249.1 DUF1641 domain-containing protein [Ignavibacteria bacterium]NNJ51608.1 DUF1641 domain-containing protein [Ignavibacteriaceae bacterium]NNL21301.1 DUF1641 domain-containing protein [Ignavibacteriaceae bacterium]